MKVSKGKVFLSSAVLCAALSFSTSVSAASPKVGQMICTAGNYYAYVNFKNIPRSGVRVFYGIWSSRTKGYVEKHYKKVYPWTLSYFNTWNGDFYPNNVRSGNFLVAKVLLPNQKHKVRKCR